MKIFLLGDITYAIKLNCTSCGRIFMSRHRTRVTEFTDVNDLPRPMPDIPVGWAMSGRDKITCKHCLNQGKET